MPCIPQDFRHEIPDFEVQTAGYARLNELDDTELLDAMAGRFDILVTTDTNRSLNVNFR